MLEVNGINVFYGEIQALWDISLSVGEGEIVALLGSNGAGKTTTLKTLSGLKQPTQGNITFHDRRLDQMEPHQIVAAGVAQVPEGRRLFPLMTVRENLEMGSLSKAAKAQRVETMAWVFELFPRLQEREKQMAGTLSGGEQQMCAIGRGLMARPKILLMDEPSLGLAPIIVQDVFRVIREINAQGVTVLLVEQNVQQALRVAHRGYVLENGHITLEGTGQELLQNPHIKEAYLGM